MNIETILKEYKIKKAYVETTVARIEQYKYAIAHPEAWYKDYIPSSSPLGMPGSPNSGGSIVENYVIGKTLNEEIIREWIRQDESRIFFKKLEIEQIECAMEKGLNKQEQYTITLKYFEGGMSWGEIELSYNNEFRQKNYVTYETLKKDNKKALNKLIRILEPFYNQFRAA